MNTAAMSLRQFESADCECSVYFNRERPRENLNADVVM